MIATCTPSVNQARTRHLANDASVTVRVSSALLVRLTFFRSADRVPSRADHADTRTYEARGAEAPRQRTARGRLQRRVGPRGILFLIIWFALTYSKGGMNQW